LLEAPIESEMLPEDADPALEADEATLSAWAGRAQNRADDSAQAPDSSASRAARGKIGRVMEAFMVGLHQSSCIQSDGTSAGRA
jgi:hypothetical protein